jgi:hypothetical protein
MWSLLGATFSDWYADRAQRLGAALAYYAILALAPGLVIVMALVRFLLGPGAESQILGQIRDLLGEQGAMAIQAPIRSARTETLGEPRLDTIHRRGVLDGVSSWPERERHGVDQRDHGPGWSR